MREGFAVADLGIEVLGLEWYEGALAGDDAPPPRTGAERWVAADLLDGHFARRARRRFARDGYVYIARAVDPRRARGRAFAAWSRSRGAASFHAWLVGLLADAPIETAYAGDELLIRRFSGRPTSRRP